MNVQSAGRVMMGVGIAGAGVGAYKAYQDQTDGEPDSINGYVGYSIVAAIGAELIGTVIGGSTGRGLAAARILAPVLGGAALGVVAAQVSGNNR